MFGFDLIMKSLPSDRYNCRIRCNRANGMPQVAVTIAERAYLGEFWDYVVAPNGGTPKLRVTASPLDIYQVGEIAFLTFDPKQMTPIS